MAAQQALHRRKGALLLLAQDASERTARDFAGLARSVGVPCLVAGTRDELGAAIGKSPRATVVITSPDFARGLIKRLSPAVPVGSGQQDAGEQG